MPNTVQLLLMPTFESSLAAFSGMDTMAVTTANTGPGSSLPVRAVAMLSTSGPYNPAASLSKSGEKSVGAGICRNVIPTWGHLGGRINSR